MIQFGSDPNRAPPEVSAVVVYWIVTHLEEARRFNGRTIFAQPFCAERGLMPEWKHEKALEKLRDPSHRHFDLAGAALAEGRSISY
jgi:hypothetical protein